MVKVLRKPLGDKSPEARLIYGVDVREGLRSLKPASVHCVVTSPPYWGLRDYGTKLTVWGGSGECEHEWRGVDCTSCGAWLGHLGLEKSPSLYVQHLVEVFREVARVLRPDGTLWLNLGDSYSGHHGNKRVPDEEAPSNKPGFVENMRSTTVGVEGLKAKDLVLIPHRVALAMQEAGWYLRSWAPWVKRTCLPEAVTDRPSNALECLFLFAHPDSRGRYYYDVDAVRKPLVEANAQRTTDHYNTSDRYGGKNGGNTGLDGFAAKMRDGSVGGRNRRNTDWFFESIELIQDGEDELLVDEQGHPLAHVINPRPYGGAHFAVMPEALVEPCLAASSSEHGVCSTCGTPWRRLTEKVAAGRVREDLGGLGLEYRRESLGLKQVNRGGFIEGVGYSTVGWEPGCGCREGSPVPATVLDPFSGSGTVGVVGLRTGRAFVGLDLNEGYLPLAEARILGMAPPSREPVAQEGVLDLFGGDS